MGPTLAQDNTTDAGFVDAEYGRHGALTDAAVFVILADEADFLFSQPRPAVLLAAFEGMASAGVEIPAGVSPLVVQANLDGKAALAKAE